MRLVELEDEPFFSLAYERARSGGGIESVQLPFLAARAEGFPVALEALVLASDLQGRVPARTGYPGRLLGIGLADTLVELARQEVLPPLDRVGILLAGDLYTLPGLAARGGLGDVREVWWTFGDIARWAAGVPGNHDDFGTDRDHLQSFEEAHAAHVLHERFVDLDGLRVAGVAGIVGKKKDTRLWHRPLKAHLGAIKSMLATRPDVLVLHEGPKLKKVDGQKGIRRTLEKSKHGCLVLCGHRHWKRPLVEMGRSQVLNLEARVVVIRPV